MLLLAALIGGVNYYFFRRSEARIKNLFKALDMRLDASTNSFDNDLMALHTKYEKLLVDTVAAINIMADDKYSVNYSPNNLLSSSPALSLPLPPEEEPLMVNIGCGSTFDSRWLNLDLVPMNSEVYLIDASKPLPLPDASVDVVYASHLLEHLAPHEVPSFLKDLHRILKPKGIVRIVVPDLEQLAKEYINSLELARQGNRHDHLYYEWMVVELLDQMVRQTADGGEMIRYLLRNGKEGMDIAVSRQGAEISETCVPWDITKSKAEWITDIANDELFSDQALFDRRSTASLLDIAKYRKSGEPHLWMYDQFSLTHLLLNHGFQAPMVCSAFTSSIPLFNDYHLDLTATGEQRKPDSLYMEALKPE